MTWSIIAWLLIAAFAYWLGRQHGRVQEQETFLRSLSGKLAP